MNGARFEIPPDVCRHLGVYLDKFVPERGTDKSAQTAALQELCRVRQDSPVYQMAFARWRAHWSALSERVVCAEGDVRDRLAVGLGAESVLENGLRVHHTYGTPLIPGSALKGVLLRGLRDLYPIGSTEGAEVEEFVFGTQERAGTARFHDAWWIPDSRPPVVLDVLTPHHQGYYSREAPPTDFDEPVPVQFLTMHCRFLFVIEASNRSWKEYLQQLLVDALERSGIGAKRSSGYGVIKVKGE